MSSRLLDAMWTEDTGELVVSRLKIVCRFERREQDDAGRWVYHGHLLAGGKVCGEIDAPGMSGRWIMLAWKPLETVPTSPSPLAVDPHAQNRSPCH